MKPENIKFKAKRLDDNSWVFGYFYEENGNTYIIENRQKESKLNRNLTYQVAPETVCQFTGMKDEDGKEIWEHDILKNYPMENEVVFKNGSFMIIEDYGDEINEVPLSEMIYTRKKECPLRIFSQQTGRRWNDEKESVDPHSQQTMVRHDCGWRKDRGVSGDKTLLD